MQTHLMSKIMHQNLAVILRQFNYSNISFILLVPECHCHQQIIEESSLHSMLESLCVYQSLYVFTRVSMCILESL